MTATVIAAVIATLPIPPLRHQRAITKRNEKLRKIRNVDKLSALTTTAARTKSNKKERKRRGAAVVVIGVVVTIAEERKGQQVAMEVPQNLATAVTKFYIP